MTQLETSSSNAGFNFIDSMPIVIGITVIALTISLTAGDKALNAFLWLVLLGMLVFNANKFSNLLNLYKGVSK